MKYLTIALGLSLAVGLPKSLLAGPSKKYINESIEKAATKVGIPTLLLKAVCSAESNLDPSAFVFSDGGNSNHAIGICQLLVSTAIGLGMSDERCRGDFRGDLTKRNHSECKLFGPYTNALFAAKVLKMKLDVYSGSWINAIASYNSGTIRICPNKGFYHTRRVGVDFSEYPIKVECIPGELLNRHHVDRVLKFIHKYRPKEVQ